jgi:hypothetical protein
MCLARPASLAYHHGMKPQQHHYQPHGAYVGLRRRIYVQHAYTWGIRRRIYASTPAGWRRASVLPATLSAQHGAGVHREAYVGASHHRQERGTCICSGATNITSCMHRTRSYVLTTNLFAMQALLLAKQVAPCTFLQCLTVRQGTMQC